MNEKAWEKKDREQTYKRQKQDRYEIGKRQRWDNRDETDTRWRQVRDKT